MSTFDKDAWAETVRRTAERLEWKKAHPVEALKEWLAGGDAFDYEEDQVIRALLAKVERLCAVEAAARTLIENDNDRKWDAMKAVPARDELVRLLLTPAPNLA